MVLKKGKLGNAIRQARLDNKLTQEELAEMVDITPTHLKHIESEHRKPSVEVLFKLAIHLHMSLDALLISDDAASEKLRQYQEIQWLLRGCSDKEIIAVQALLRELSVT